MDAADEASFDDNIVAHYDWTISALDVDCNGKFAALASKKWIALIDLDKAAEPSGRRKLMRDSKWETHTLRWNPHASDSDVLLASLNFKIEVWRTESADAGKRQLLRAHTLRVSDLCWSPTEPHLFASCSMDAFVYIWDLRDARKPCTAMKTIAGSSQVKWNSFNDNILASAHDMDVRLWDRRKPQIASQYISAHIKQIHGMDWCPTVAHKLSTCSHDGRVQVWNTEQARISQPETTLNIGAPVWRTKFTPFGYGMVTTLRSQLHGVPEHNLQLWNLADVSAPVHSYSGHTDAVLDFTWQTKNSGDRKNYIMMSASKDQTLRSWMIDEQVRRVCTPGGGDRAALAVSSSTSLSLSSSLPLSAVAQLSGSFHDGMELGGAGEQDDGKNVSRAPSGHDLALGAAVLSQADSSTVGMSLTSSDTSAGPVPAVFAQPHTLAHEFALLNLQIDGLHVDKLDAGQRICIASVTGAQLYAQVTISFPALYPNDAAPSFHFSDKSTIDNSGKSQLTSVLISTSKSLVSLNRPCLEPCLRDLVAHMRSGLRPINSVSRAQSLGLSRPATSVVTSYGNTLDDHVPFPRTSGARFCGNGFLVIFKRPETLKAPPNVTTPRSLAELALICNSYRRPGPPSALQQRTASISGYYRLNQDSGPSLVKPIAIYETALLLKLHKSLALSARLSEDVKAMCAHNGNAALAEGRDDLRRAWQVMQAVTESHTCVDSLTAESKDLVTPWPQHPFGRQMAASLIRHYSSVNDIQAVALLACACFTYLRCKQPAPPPPPPPPAILGPAAVTAAALPAPAQTRSSSFVASSSSSASTPYHASTPSGAHLYSSNSSPSHHHHHGSHGGSHGVGGSGGGSGGLQQQRGIGKALASAYHSMTLALPDARMPRTTTLASSPTLSTPYNLSGELMSPGYGDSPSDDEHFLRTSLLDADTIDRCLQCCWWYAEVLHRWEMFEQRAELLHCVGAISTQESTDRHVVKTLCSNCKEVQSGPNCSRCHTTSRVKCAICHIPVKGLSHFCLDCCHGGHWDHMASWFEASKVCPTGCGCACVS
ncbi:GATOR2 complex protein WDR59-like isoform X1 [Sycon ciliatum]|uniref:GATOR2 complex protein WDR59-like isoform X1 n=2 Tax=Sycon ciliatum TaxID=27933 RepID=UPI0031F6F6B9